MKKTFSLVSGIAVLLAAIFFILTFSIALPIYIRGFYFCQIESLGIEENTGYDAETIKGAYNGVMDYLTLGKEFSCGTLGYSESGKAHFEDCKKLFDLNLAVLCISAAILLIAFVLRKLRLTDKIKIFGFVPTFWSGILALVLPSALGIYAAIDFDSAFTLFHTVFFPGKENWLFDPSVDEIIRILPSRFFAGCGIFIAVSVLLISAALILRGVLIKAKTRKTAAHQ